MPVELIGHEVGRGARPLEQLMAAVTLDDGDPRRVGAPPLVEEQELGEEAADDAEFLAPAELGAQDDLCESAHAAATPRGRRR